MIDLFQRLNAWLRRDSAMGRYRQGMAHAKRHDHPAALDDYTSVIDMAGTSADLLAMALYNRAIVYSAMNNLAAAVVDLRRLLDMDGAAANVKTEARRKLVRMERALIRTEGQSRPSQEA